MRVVSRVLVAAAFATLPGLLSAQSVAPQSAELRMEQTSSVAPVSLIPDGGAPQGVSAGVTTAAEPAQGADARADAGDAAQAAPDHGPSLTAATAGIRANTTKNDLTTQRADHHGGLGTGGALMIVGGAALIIGLIIGGSAGIIIAIAGAAVGLYGLFLFLQ